MTYFITIAGRRWPAEETFKTGKDVLGWDQSQARAWHAVCRHTALAALAQLRAAAIRNALCGGTGLAPAVPAAGDRAAPDDGDDVNDADLQIPLGDAPVPVRGGQPCPPRIAPIRLSVAETARLTRLAAQAAAGADHPRPARLRPALVRPPKAPPGHRPMAPPQRPAPRRSRHRPTRHDQEGGNAM